MRDYDRKPYHGVYRDDKKVRKDPPLIVMGTIAAALAAVGILILIAGAYFVVMPMFTTTTTTTTTTTLLVTTTTTSSTTTSSSTTSSTTTTTLPSFYVCDKNPVMQDTFAVQCQSRDRLGKVTGEWHAVTKRATIEAALNESIVDGGYTETKAKITGQTCLYSITDISFEVGQLESCIKPVGKMYMKGAELIDPN